MTDDNPTDEGENGRFSRRRFMQATGAVAGGALLGVGTTGTAAAAELHDEFRDRRVQEAKQAWDRGFRGQPTRTAGQMTTGFDTRHPDVGPWNGIRARPDGNGGLRLVRENYERLSSTEEKNPPSEVEPLKFKGSFAASPGNQRAVHGPFSPPEDADRLETTLIGRVVTHRAALFQYAHYDLRFAIEREVTDGQWEVVEEMSQGYGLSENADTIIAPDGARPPVRPSVGIEVDPDETYRFVVETGDDGNVFGTYASQGQYLTQTDPTEAATDPFENVNPNNVTAGTPKVVGWYNEDHYWGPFANPRHERTNNRNVYEDGTHFASPIAGSGRASTIDEGTVFAAEPNKVLGPGDKLTYEVQAEPGRGVFASAFGQFIEVAILYDGEIIDTHFLNNGLNGTNVTTEAITVHDSGTETYTVEVTPGLDNGPSPRNGVARVERVSGGAFKHPETTAGERTGGDRTMFAGVAPNASLLGIGGYTETRDRLEDFADDFVDTFNLRVLHIVGETHLRPGIAAGKLSNVGVFKDLAEAGILVVSPALAGTAGYKDRAPALADETIGTVPTDPLDGIYFNKGLAGTHPQVAVPDEDGDGVYRKPDVVAPDGGITDLSSTKAVSGNAYIPEEDQTPIRTYHNVTGPEGSPFVSGLAALVAEAMEKQAPEGIALPPPEQTGFDDVMRLKHTILATATETALTAAPYHGPRQKPTYSFGGWDPFEGWGRVNVDAAIDAVTRDLTPGESTPTTVRETVGLDIPRHSRAVAGYIDGEPGAYEVTVEFAQYDGEDVTLQGGPPHIDLFVYDAENPAEPAGTPNVVGKAQGVVGSASVQFEAGGGADGSSDASTYYVVAKLVNVPGAVNGFDVQAQFDLSVERTDANVTETGTDGTIADGTPAGTGTDGTIVSEDPLGDTGIELPFPVFNRSSRSPAGDRTD